MRITALVPTHHLPVESMPWIAEARNVFDEVVVLIDAKRVTPGTEARAEKVATRTVRNTGDHWYDPNRFSILEGCESDWVFILEYDEQLSAEWQQKDQWRQILETTPFTHFWFSRRWILPGKERYINCDPWFPDFQLRLFRNHLEGTEFPATLHELIRIPGPSAYFKNLAIHHHVLWMWSRAKRIEKVRYYEQLRPGGGQSYIYLHEDYSPPDAPVPESKKLDIHTELVSMQKLLPEEMSRVSIKLKDFPKAVRTSEVLWLEGWVTNPTARTLSSCHQSLGVHLAYHWFDRTARRIVVWDGCRTRLFPGATARMTSACTMMIVAPNQAGEYLLQISLVQEGVCWFEEIRPGIVQEFRVLVTDRIGSPVMAADG